MTPVHGRGPYGHLLRVPELPDVEGLRRVLARTAAGRVIRAVHVPAPEILRNTTPQALGRVLAGRTVGEPGRHGKWLSAPARDRAGREAVLLMHFGMDGGLNWTPAGEGRQDRYDRLILHCDGGQLRYHSVRKLGGVWLLAPGGDAREVTGPLGPDALGLDEPGLAKRLAGRRHGIKSALMDQSVVAGLGNLTVDEILWRARLPPRLRAGDLGRADLRRLHTAVRDVLAESVPAGRVPERGGWLTAVRGEPEPGCPRCGTRLTRARVVGRSTLWCPRCQPAGPR